MTIFAVIAPLVKVTVVVVTEASEPGAVYLQSEVMLPTVGLMEHVTAPFEK